MLLMIDNYDSFTYNLVQYFGELNTQVLVYRNDNIDIAGIEKLKPAHICISPGPCSPNQAGISLEVIKHFADKLPILGVCLGHQAIGQAFGGEIIRAKQIMHGKVSRINITQPSKIFQNLPQQFKVTRYHSLAIQAQTFPQCLEATAFTDDGEIMAIQHKTLPIFGVQFHPEAILSEYGHEILGNFLKV